MPTVSLSQSVTIGGVVISGRNDVDEEGQIGVDATLEAGHAGTLSTRTDADTGVATVGSGHGITTANLVDVYWTGGKRLGMTVTATGATTINVDGGSGDNFPVVSTAIVVSKVYALDCVFTGSDAAVIGIALERTGCVNLRGSTTNYLSVVFSAAGQAYIWTSPATNPVSGASLDTIRASNSDPSNTCRLRVGVLYNAA